MNVVLARPLRTEHGIDGFLVDSSPVNPQGTVNVARGATIELFGWAIDAATKRGVDEVLAQTENGTLICYGRTRGNRPDIGALHGPDAAASGFSLPIHTTRLAPGDHRVQVVFRAQGAECIVGSFTLSVGPRSTGLTHILCAGSPKSGSQHVTTVLRRYYGIDDPPIRFHYHWEHELGDDLLDQIRTRSSVVHLHTLARLPNLEWLRANRFSTVVTWRNLGDTVVSYDDHMRKTMDTRGPALYVDDLETYLAMPDQARYQFIIRNAIPWYFVFYLTWRKSGFPLFTRYEWMARDPVGYFSHVIQSLDGSVDAERLRAVVAPSSTSGFNEGIVGRSSSKLSDESKALLETLILTHEADLGELYLELPWVENNLSGTAGTPSVVASENGNRYLVADRVKRLVPDKDWLLNHQIFSPASVPALSSLLETDREGAPLF